MRKIGGYIIIGIGAIFVLATYLNIPLAIDLLWPVFLLIPAIGFHIFFFMNPQPNRAGLLVPGGILLVYAPLFFFSQLFLGGDMSTTWPFFLIGPAVGLTELYIFGNRKPALLIPIGILTVIAIVFLISNLASTQVGGILGLLLIVLGGIMVTRKKNDHYPM
ncbi:LPXTG cell wall anchor domain-containing protein [Brevibacillus brevis]|uniref:LPXTG cell wall anchor domain-containing protein n=1 Tax=Brevibacillus brevis TaxID=1393 RepID=A0A517I1Z4_BREBE|nr:LPXTG cell wall anchor domain-containing protein [Brevibacillus brevis]QDS32922.1 LPXTG cell wall anchor domain-containing protein [Brevibacillus brevis]